MTKEAYSEAARARAARESDHTARVHALMAVAADDLARAVASLRGAHVPSFQLFAAHSTGMGTYSPEVPVGSSVDQCWPLAPYGAHGGVFLLTGAGWLVHGHVVAVGTKKEVKLGRASRAFCVCLASRQQYQVPDPRIEGPFARPDAMIERLTVRIPRGRGDADDYDFDGWLADRVAAAIAGGTNP